MSTAKWTTPGTESSNIAGATLDALADGSATGIMADLTNGTGKDLYVALWVELGSFTPGTGGSLALRLRRKRGGTYEDATTSCIVAAKTVASGASAKAVEFSIVLPGPFTYGVELVNNTGSTLAASGNAVVYQTFNEEIV